MISPLLANIYLHEVLDKWFERDVKPRLRGRAFLVRYADDVVMVFASETDARRVLDVLPKRFGKYGLTLHPEKTRLVEFRPHGREDSQPSHQAKRSFDFLGFTHYWARSRRGTWVVKRKTAGSRFSRALKRVYRVVPDASPPARAPGSTSSSCGSCAGTTRTTGSPATSTALSRFRLRGARGSGASGSIAAPTRPA